MSQGVTLEIVGAMAEQLQPEDQRRLMEQIHERIAQRENYTSRIANFLKMCEEVSIPGDGMRRR